MAEFHLTLTDEERQYLLNLLGAALKDKRVEEHRTRKPSYREHVIHEEAIAEGFLDKLRHATGCPQ